VNTQTQIKPPIYERDGVYELVWRMFGSKYVNEPCFLYDTNDPDGWVNQTIFPKQQYREHCFYPDDNHFLERGFPEPQLGGSLIERNLGRRKYIKRKRFFMDDLFLCPNCGAFYQDHSFPQIPWLDIYRGRIDTVAMLAAIEQRKDQEEFDIMPCAQRDHRLRNCCENFVWKFRKGLKRKAKEAALLAPKPPSNPYIYLIGSQGHVKIGIAVDVRSRLSTLQTSSPLKLKLLKSWKCLNAVASEKMLHKKFSKFRQSGEWFQFPDNVLQNLIVIDDLGVFLQPVRQRNFVKP
jgi:hypothetical protein